MSISNSETKKGKQKESIYMELSPEHLSPVVHELSKTKDYVLIDMYRPYLEKTLEGVNQLEEELKIIKKYFGNRFVIVKDDVSRLTTFPDNYFYDFDNNKFELCQNFIQIHIKKNKKVNNIFTKKKTNTYGYQSFVNRYSPFVNNEIKVTHRILKTSLNHYKELFRTYVIQEIAKDRNRYKFSINYIYNPTRYPNKHLSFFFDDSKKLLNQKENQILENKIDRLLKIRKGKSGIYHVEAFVSAYLAEVVNIKGIRPQLPDKLSRYNSKVNFPEQQIIETPETFIGDIYDIIKKLPQGTQVTNVENILRQDLVWRFKKYQEMLKEKYPTKTRNHEIEIGYHGTREDRLYTIVRDGLIIPKKDNGLDSVTCGARYGNGIYLSPESRLSMHYCRGDGCLLVCAVLAGRKYVCNYDMWDSGVMPSYDSHISHDKTELVLFNEAQVLPCIVIHFKTNEIYQDWWDVYYNKTKKRLTYREQMATMNSKEKKEFLKSFADSYLSYGFGKGDRFEVEDVQFPDEIDYCDSGVEWYGTVNNEYYSKYQEERYEYSKYNPSKEK